MAENTGKGKHEMDPSAGTGSSSIDVNDPIFVHAAENRALNLVQKFEGTGFLGWRFDMITALKTKKKYSFVTGKIKKPEETDSIRYASWERANSLVVRWIKNSLGGTVLQSVRYLDDPKEIWDTLCRRYEHSNLAVIHALKRELAEVKKNDLSVVEYFNKLKTVWGELEQAKPVQRCSCGNCTCNVNKSIKEAIEVDKLVHFLMGLNRKYLSIRGQTCSPLSHTYICVPIYKNSKIWSLHFAKENG